MGGNHFDCFHVLFILLLCKKKENKSFKKYKNSDAIWLLRDRVVYRTVYSYDLSIINTTGNISPMTSLNNSYGVAPAFRIG